MGRFTRFKDGKDVGTFPDSRDISRVNRVVEESGEIGDTFGT